MSYFASTKFENFAEFGTTNWSWMGLPVPYLVVVQMPSWEDLEQEGEVAFVASSKVRVGHCAD